MESAKPTTIVFAFNEEQCRWWWKPYGKLVPETVSKGQWDQFSLWVTRQDEGRVGFEEAVEEFKRVISASNNKRVLAIDDEPGLCTLLTVMLTRFGLRVKTMTNPVEGLDLLRHEEFDLVTLDIMMPEMDGFQVLEQIRADPRWDKMPVLMLTARADTEAISRALSLGADGYLTTPYITNSLIDRVTALLAHGRKKPFETLEKARPAKKKKR